MTAAENILVSLRAALELNPGDEVARLALADWHEEQGDEKGAALQRKIAALQPYRRLSPDECQAIVETYSDWWPEQDGHIRITEGWDGDLCVAFFLVDTEDGREGDPTEYVICQSRGDLSRKKLEKGDVS